MVTKRTDSWRTTDFERWFDVNPYLLDGERILIIDRRRPLRRAVELTALDREGGLVVLAVTSVTSDWRAVGQVLESLAHREDLSTDDFSNGAGDASAAFRDAFTATFGTEPPAVSPRRRAFLVAPWHDAHAAIGVRYLSRHLAQGGLSIQLLKATKSLGGFTLERFVPPPLKRTSTLDRTFAVSSEGRVFYVLEPGSPSVVWNVGRQRERDGTLAFRSRPSRRTLRHLSWHLMPIQHPEQVDLSYSGTVWTQHDRPDRLAKVIGTLRESSGATQVAFAAFRGGEFRAFRQKPGAEFFAQWTASEETLPGWGAIATLAREQAGVQA